VHGAGSALFTMVAQSEYCLQSKHWAGYSIADYWAELERPWQLLYAAPRPVLEGQWQDGGRVVGTVQGHFT